MKKIIFVMTFLFAISSVSAKDKFIDKSLEKNHTKDLNIGKSIKYGLLNGTKIISFKVCKITHNFRDDEGNLLGSVHYEIETDFDCKAVSDGLKRTSALLLLDYWGLL